MLSLFGNNINNNNNNISVRDFTAVEMNVIPVLFIVLLYV